MRDLVKYFILKGVDLQGQANGLFNSGVQESNVENLIRKLEQEKKNIVSFRVLLVVYEQIEERKKLERIISSYKACAHEMTDEPDELKSHLVFNEAQNRVRFSYRLQSLSIGSPPILQ